MRISLSLLLICFFLSSGMLFAQAEQFGYEVGPYAGWANWKDRNFQVGPPQANPPIKSNLSYRDKAVYGIRFDLLSKGYWGGELTYAYQQNTVTLSRQAFAPVGLSGGIHQFFYNTLLYPMQYEQDVIPYVTAGLGLAGYHLSDEARAKAADPRGFGLGTLESTDKRFAFNYGAGIKAKVSSHFGVRVDFRHNFSDVPSYGLPKESSNPAQIVLPIQGKLQSYEFSAGIFFHTKK